MKKLSVELIKKLEEVKQKNIILKGTVIGVGPMEYRRLDEHGNYQEVHDEVAVLGLNGGVEVICPKDEFADYNYKSLGGFTGSEQEFVLVDIDSEKGIALVSVKKATHLRVEQLWSEVEKLEREGKLKDKIFEGTVTGYNPETGVIYVNVQGKNAFMFRRDWGTDIRPETVAREAVRGRKISVKVVRSSKEEDKLQVSRKSAIPDPFDDLEDMMKLKTITGTVDNVHSIHGIFVRLHNGLVAKASKPRYLEEPVVGEVVTCRLKEFDRQNKRIKVVIIDYPNAKVKVDEPNLFLFD
jgi:small subunit ribosomal protein S1